MMRYKTYYKRVLELQEEYRKASKESVAEFDKRINIEYDLAYSEMAAKLRALFVDANYEFFHTDGSLLFGKVLGFLSRGLAMFHERAYEGRPEKPEIDHLKPPVEYYQEKK